MAGSIKLFIKKTPSRIGAAFFMQMMTGSPIRLANDVFLIEDGNPFGVE